MANFTMEIREMMNQALINGVFTFDYEFYSDNLQDKESFEKLFISHFYFREIGFETPERFKMKLQAKLNLTGCGHLHNLQSVLIKVIMIP